MPWHVLNNIQQIFDTFSFGILIEDGDRRILYTNKRFLEIFGIPPETDLKGMNCLQAADEARAFFKDGDRFAQEIRDIPLEQQTREQLVETADGRYFRRKYDPMFEEGKLIAHIWNYEEVTELTRKEHELIQERNFFHTILNEIPADIAIFSPDHRYLFLNRTAVRDEQLRNWMIGKDDYDYYELRGLGKEKAAVRRKLFEQAKEQKKPVSWIDELHKEGGETNYVLRIFYPYLNADRDLELMIGYGININDQKSKEEEIKQQRNRFLKFIETLTEGVIQIAANGTILFHNERLQQLLRVRSGEIGTQFSKNLLRLIAPEDVRKMLRSFVRLRKGRQTQTGVCRIGSGGKTGYLEYSIWSTESPSAEESYFGKLQDITGQVVHEQYMQTVIEKEKELSSLKSHFIHITSHELRTPLSVILSSAEILEMINGMPEAGVQMKPASFTQSIIREVNRITTILNELLMIGRIENGKLKFEPARTDLISLTKELCEEQFLPYRDGRMVRFHMAGQPVYYHADASLMKHAIGNLLDNAFKYSAGAVAPEISVRTAEDRVEITVADLGIGIPEDEKNQLFHSFYRASNVGTISGTGLGLMVVEHVARLHGADISVKSNLGAGTTFTLSFPKQK